MKGVGVEEWRGGKVKCVRVEGWRGEGRGERKSVWEKKKTKFSCLSNNKLIMDRQHQQHRQNSISSPPHNTPASFHSAYEGSPITHQLHFTQPTKVAP